jgi:hypothetical protein
MPVLPLLVSFCQKHRVACSPDRAKRYPGTAAQLARSFPDFADAQSGLRSVVVPNIFNCQTALRDVAFRQKNIGPCSVAGRGASPDFRFLPPPSNRGGWRADKAHGPDCSGRGVRIAPDDEVHCGAPRALRRANAGILAFMPSTVVGPGRLLVADEAARVPPGDEGCVTPSLAGAAPVPRSQDASRERPSKMDRDGSKHSYATSEVKHCFHGKDNLLW